MSFTAAPRRRLALLFVGCLVATLGLAVVNPASAGKPSGGGGTTLPTPTQVVILSMASDFTRSADFPAPGDGTVPVPTVVVAAFGTIRVSVELRDANGDLAAFKKDTALRVTSSVGIVGETSGTAFKGESTAFVDTRVTEPINQVALSVSAGSGTSLLTSSPSVTFDVLSLIKPNLTASSKAAFEEGIGGNSSCVSAEPLTPVCGIVRLPRGSGTNVLLSVGACDVVKESVPRYAPCYEGPKGPGGAVVQTLFTQPSIPYTTGSPATIILKCDKTLCGTGPIQRLTVLFSLSGNTPLTAPDACPAKGTMATAGKPCVDYVQSKRDGSGDTHLFLLTDRDIRTGIG